MTSKIEKNMQSANGEQGLSLVLVSFLVFAIVAITALVVDHLRLQSSLQQIQRAADAAALAGARQFDGKATSWERARNAALDVLAKNTVLGGGAANNLSPVITRGVVEYDNTFKSYEDGSAHVDGEGRAYGLPRYLIANAVKVTLTLDELPFSFARLFGMGSKFTDLQRTSFALVDRTIKYPVAPLAIPACQLLLDVERTHPGGDSSYDHLLAEYRPATQCGRELLFTDPDPRNPDTSDLRRREGYMRYSMYTDHPDVDYRPDGRGDDWCFGNFGAAGRFWNCKAITIEGVLGTADSTRGGVADTGALTLWLQRMMSGQNLDFTRVGIGQWFHPIADSQNPPISYQVLNPLEQDLAEWIHNGASEGTTISSDFSALNRPSIRGAGGSGSFFTQYNERIFRWPVYFSREGQRMLLQGFAGTNYTNPLCHSYRLRHNDPNEGVRDVTAMVIVPTDEDYQYCDFRGTFNPDLDPGSTAPLAATLPRVVGFVNIKLFDFSAYDYDLLFPPPSGLKATPRYPARADTANGWVGGIGDLVDNNPTKIEFYSEALQRRFGQKAREYIDDHEDWTECIEREEDDSVCGDPPRMTAEDFSHYAECFDLGWASRFFANTQALINTIEQCETVQYCPRGQQNEDGSCRVPLEERQECAVDNRRYLAAIANMLQAMNYGLLSIFTDPYMDARPGKHCFPLHPPEGRSTCRNITDPACWEVLKPRDAGYGCGGIRARLDCTNAEDSANFASPNLESKRRPSLVLIHREV